MEHYPEIVHRNAEYLADLFAAQAVNFPQCKSAGRARRQGRKAIVENFPKLSTLDQFRRRRVPLTGRVAGIPMICPFICPGKEFLVLESLILGLSDGRLAGDPPKMVRNLMFQNPDEPGPLGSPTLQAAVGFYSRQERS